MLLTAVAFCDREQNTQAYQTIEARCPDFNRDHNNLDGLPYDVNILAFNKQLDSCLILHYVYGSTCHLRV